MKKHFQVSSAENRSFLRPTDHNELGTTIRLQNLEYTYVRIYLKYTKENVKKICLLQAVHASATASMFVFAYHSTHTVGFVEFYLSLRLPPGY